MNLLDMFEGREPHQQAIDRLEQARINHLKEKMDYYAKHGMAKEFMKAKEEHDGYHKVQDECMGYGGSMGESGIGHDIVNKTEKMARATPSTPASKVVSTAKNAAKWLAGKGGPGKEGPTYESADDIEDQGEYDEEGDMVKDNLHTIRREADRLEKILSNSENVPEWVQDKLAQVKGMITSASEYMQTQRERDHEEASGEEGLTMAEAQKKNSEEVEEAGHKPGWALDPKTRLELKKRKDRQKTIAKWAGKPVPPQDKEKEVDEGWSDAIVAQRTGRPRTPYSVYIKGKKWKDFENEDHAENVANKLRAKFKQEGKDASVITIAPTDYDKGMEEAYSKTPPNLEILQDLAQQWQAGSDEAMDQLNDLGWNISDDRKGVYIIKQSDMSGRSKIYFPELATEDTGSWIVYDPATKAIKKRFKTHTAGKSYAKTHNLGFASSEYYFDNIKDQKAIAEDQDTSGVESAIIRRIMLAHTDLLKQFGPEKVMQAAEEVAYNVGDVDEIGSSDISAYVHQVKQILGAVNEEQVNEKWSEKYKRSINCSNPKGFSQKAHCAGRKK
jgi:hypothetical protein